MVGVDLTHFAGFISERRASRRGKHRASCLGRFLPSGRSLQTQPQRAARLPDRLEPGDQHLARCPPYREMFKKTEVTPVSGCFLSHR